MTKRFYLVLVLAGVAGLLTPLTTVGQNKAVSQESVPMEIGEEMGKHLIDTETISLSGKLEKGDFKLLMDITPYMSEGGHIALKVPCGKDGEQLLSVLAGVAPDVKPVELQYVEPLSNAPDSCVYHAELGEGITDIALANTSDKGIMFFGKSSGGYSATITIHGEIGEAPMMHE